MNRTEALPLKAAYQFGDARGLTTEVENIRRMRIGTPVRRGYIAHLFGSRGLLQPFIDEWWSFGRTPEGQKKLRYYERLRKRHDELAHQAVLPNSIETVETTSQEVSADDLAKWRREILRLLDTLDARAAAQAGPVGRITRLKAERVIPRHIAALMIAIVEMRNTVEYENTQPTLAESLAVRYAHTAVLQWAHPR
jgi:hypothetical protein